MSERRITTLLLMGFGAAVTGMLEIIHLFLDFGDTILIGIGMICALLLWVIFYLDDLKHKI
jgi:hypothetical protein